MQEGIRNSQSRNGVTSMATVPNMLIQLTELLDRMGDLIRLEACPETKLSVNMKSHGMLNLEREKEKMCLAVAHSMFIHLAHF